MAYLKKGRWLLDSPFGIFARQRRTRTTILVLLHTVALRFRRALRASVLYSTEARKAQKIIGDTVCKSELKMQKKPGFWVVPWAAQGIEAHHSDGSGRIFWFFGFWSLPPSLFFHIWLVFKKNWFGTLNSGQIFYPKWISVHTVNIMYWNNLGISKLTRIHFKCMYYISSIQERNV